MAEVYLLELAIDIVTTGFKNMFAFVMGIAGFFMVFNWLRTSGRENSYPLLRTARASYHIRFRC